MCELSANTALDCIVTVYPCDNIDTEVGKAPAGPLCFADCRCWLLSHVGEIFTSRHLFPPIKGCAELSVLWWLFPLDDFCIVMRYWKELIRLNCELLPSIGYWATEAFGPTKSNCWAGDAQCMNPLLPGYAFAKGNTDWLLRELERLIHPPPRTTSECVSVWESV